MYFRLLTVLLVALGAVQAGTISLVPSAASVGVGQFFAVDVNVSAAFDLYAYQFDVSFDPAVFQAVTVDQGDFLAQGGATLFFAGVIDNSGGTVSLNAESLETAVAGVSGDGTLVKFGFQAIAPGTSQIGMPSLFLFDSNLNGLALDVVNGSVFVAATPEPSSLLLTLCGAALLFRRRFSALL